ncbi:MAG: hypothetical protein ACYDDU_05450 [Dermatophilaceae bacterium]
MELIPRPYGHPDVVALTGEVQAHYRDLYGGPGDESAVDEADFEAPTGHFVVGYVDDVPVAMGGWRRLGSTAYPGTPRSTDAVWPLRRRARRHPPRQAPHLSSSADRTDRSSPQVPAGRLSSGMALRRERLPG